MIKLVVPRLRRRRVGNRRVHCLHCLHLPPSPPCPPTYERTHPHTAHVGATPPCTQPPCLPFCFGGASGPGLQHSPIWTCRAAAAAATLLHTHALMHRSCCNCALFDGQFECRWRCHRYRPASRLVSLHAEQGLPSLAAVCLPVSATIPWCPTPAETKREEQSHAGCHVRVGGLMAVSEPPTFAQPYPSPLPPASWPLITLNPACPCPLQRPCRGCARPRRCGQRAERQGPPGQGAQPGEPGKGFGWAQSSDPATWASAPPLPGGGCATLAPTAGCLHDEASKTAHTSPAPCTS